MSTFDPRRDAEDARAEPATAVAADTTNHPSVDPEGGRRAAPTEPDGAIRDSERGDAESGSTRVLPATENPRIEHDRRVADDRPTVASPVVAPAPADRADTAADRPLNPRAVLAREKEQFGGMRFWLAFFGWLTATGLAVLLGAIAAGIFAAAANSTGATTTSAGLQSFGLPGAIVTAVILFVAYYAGGYVAGRMARFDGAKQGVAVWLWAIIITVLAAIAGAIGGSFGLFSTFANVAQVPFNAQTLTVVGLVGIVAALALSLIGAVLGGLAGMHYHRRVDRAAFGA